MKRFLTLAAASSLALMAACTEEPDAIETDTLGADQTAITDPVGTVGTWDTNNDGIFDEAEYTAWGERGISEWDTDADGMLSMQEFDAGWTEAGFNNGNDVFLAWDDDNDGFLTDDEFFDDEEWGEWDANNSGMLENDEFANY
ncbi:hypothetical protein J3454_13390 [Erythrobacter sp. NFXS35]|uniref:hypothetical protein n=1 Tax=Erythrobacter sp. NFXS35 TaxID=2818436 RepID=UPI0032DE5F40